jgi:phosphopantothenoylcysteine decarboxylase
MTQFASITMDKLQTIWRTRQDDIRTILLSVSVSILTSLAFNALILSRQQETVPSQRQSSSNQDQEDQNPLLPIPPPLTASHHAHEKKHHLLLCATGSVATIKLPLIVSTLLSHHGPSKLSIKILLTPSAAAFLQFPSDSTSPFSQSPPHRKPSPTPSPHSHLASTPGVEGIYFNEDEWRTPWTRGAPILHIELRRWADVMVIAPLSANSLSKIATGSGEGLVASVVRAWDFSGNIDGVREVMLMKGEKGEVGRRSRKKRIIVAPAMNTAMWMHPVTGKHLRVLDEEWGVDNSKSAAAGAGAADGDDDEEKGEGWIEVLRPVEKTLACGDVGGGAMREWTEIVEIIEQRLGLVVGGKERE